MNTSIDNHLSFVCVEADYFNLQNCLNLVWIGCVFSLFSTEDFH